jgi:hypothetical protein
VNVFGPAHTEKSHFKGVFGCIVWQSFMNYGGNKSIKENSLPPWVLIPEDSRHSTVIRKIPLFSVEPVTISYTHYWVRWFLPVKYFTCKNCLHWHGTFFIIFIFSIIWIQCTPIILIIDVMICIYFVLIWTLSLSNLCNIGLENKVS